MEEEEDSLAGGGEGESSRPEPFHPASAVESQPCVYMEPSPSMQRSYGEADFKSEF